MSFLKDKVEYWLQGAKWAASGGNSQPWKVTFYGDDKSVHLVLSIDSEYRRMRHSPMDVNGVASVWALGGLGLNLEVCAAYDGYVLQEVGFVIGEENWSSEVRLHFLRSTSCLPEYPIEGLFLRRTNRGFYETTPVSDQVLEKISKVAALYSESVKLVDATQKKEETNRGLIGLERLRWRNSRFLNSLFDEISFNERNQYGIPADQLGINSLDMLMVKINKNILATRKLIQWGSYKYLARKNLTQLLKNSAGVFFLQAKSHDFSANYYFGYVYQKIWTELNQNNYAFQPVSQALLALDLMNSKKLTSEERQAIDKAQEYFSSNYGFDLSLPILGFRTGVCKEGCAKSPRVSIPAIEVQFDGKKALDQEFGDVEIRERS